jgi:hypothetical protein
MTKNIHRCCKYVNFSRRTSSWFFYALTHRSAFPHLGNVFPVETPYWGSRGYPGYSLEVPYMLGISGDTEVPYMLGISGDTAGYVEQQAFCYRALNALQAGLCIVGSKVTTQYVEILMLCSWVLICRHWVLLHSIFWVFLFKVFVTFDPVTHNLACGAFNAL